MVSFCTNRRKKAYGHKTGLLKSRRIRIYIVPGVFITYYYQKVTSSCFRYTASFVYSPIQITSSYYVLNWRLAMKGKQPLCSASDTGLQAPYLSGYFLFAHYQDPGRVIREQSCFYTSTLGL